MPPKSTAKSDEFVARLIANRSRVEIFLLHGVCLRGVIVSHDDAAVFLGNSSRSKASQMVYKHSISTIMLERPKEARKNSSNQHKPRR